MIKSFFYGTLSALALSGVATAETPSVAVDIPPIHSLVAQVMQGVGTPNLIVQPGASPHGYSLRPSEAATLQSADIVFWVSESLTPWLNQPINTLATNAKSVELLETDGTTELKFRTGATFDKDSHDDHADGEETDAHGHDGQGHDPHAWLDPENARNWLDVIATDLAALNPENAETYAANAALGNAELTTLIDEINTDLKTFRGTNFIVFHDAYQYFENRFDISAIGAISLGDASTPSPARIAEIRDKVVKLGVKCAFSEPQFNSGLVQAVFQGTGAVTGVLDTLGSDIPLGTDLYPQLLRNLANNLAACLK